MEGHAKIKVNWKEGLHIRPATYIVKLLQNYSCDVKFIKDGTVCNAKSVIQILTLGAECGDNLLIEAYGLDAIEAVESLQKFFVEYEDREAEKKRVLW